MEKVSANPWIGIGLAVVGVALAAYVHMRVRRWAGRTCAEKILAKVAEKDLKANFMRAFMKNTRWWRSIFRRKPAGWNRRNMARLARVVAESNGYVQTLNDVYANPAGRVSEEFPSDSAKAGNPKECEESVSVPGKNGDSESEPR